MNAQHDILDESVINQLIKDVGIDTTKVFLDSLESEFNLRTQKITQARDEQSLDKLASEAHSFKGCALTCGAKALSNLLLQLETLAKYKKSEAFELVNQVIDLARETNVAFHEYKFQV